jgi:hypothetical protein
MTRKSTTTRTRRQTPAKSLLAGSEILQLLNSRTPVSCPQSFPDFVNRSDLPTPMVDRDDSKS